MFVVVFFMIHSTTYSSDDKSLFSKYAVCGKNLVSLAEQGAIAATLTEKSDAVYQIKKTLYGCLLTETPSIKVGNFSVSGDKKNSSQGINSYNSFDKNPIIVFHPSMNLTAAIKKDSDHTPAN